MDKLLQKHASTRPQFFHPGRSRHPLSSMPFLSAYKKRSKHQACAHARAREDLIEYKRVCACEDLKAVQVQETIWWHLCVQVQNEVSQCRGQYACKCERRSQPSIKNVRKCRRRSHCVASNPCACASAVNDLVASRIYACARGNLMVLHAVCMQIQEDILWPCMYIYVQMQEQITP